MLTYTDYERRIACPRNDLTKDTYPVPHTYDILAFVDTCIKEKADGIGPIPSHIGNVVLVAPWTPYYGPPAPYDD